MFRHASFPLILMTAVALIASLYAEKSTDPFLWLEEVEGRSALEWVESHNQATIDILEQQPDFPDIKETCLTILNSKERIAYPSIRGQYIYNFWQGESAERGLWRRTPREEYFKPFPVWETLLDLDELSKTENEKWSYKGVSVLAPDFELGMVKLSRGGSDAVEIREFNLKSKTFVKNGFFVEQAKSRIAWFDRDTLLIGTDFGEESMTSSGYPRIAKIWKRGTPLSEAKTVYEGKSKDVSVQASVHHNPERTYALIVRAIAFYQSEFFAFENGTVIKLNLPEDADIHGFFKKQMLLEMKSDWKVKGITYPQGALVSMDYEMLLKGMLKVQMVYTPEDRASLASVSSTENHLFLTLFKHGQYDELMQCDLEKKAWVKTRVDVPGHGTLSVVTADDYSDQYFFTYESMLSPRSLYYVPGDGQKMSLVKSLPEYFNADDFRVELYESTSKDGTKIPYSVVLPKAALLDGSHPALLYGYGGFEVSLRPHYSSIVGTSWLSRGGVYVMANIRGGGEFGPEWHQAALKENRQRAYDDFISVAEDLIRRGICSSKSLGIMGGSNGGLLVGAVAMQRPDLYNAVVCSVPLLDMKRFNKLLAGASWMGEYGNPDVPEEWAYISKYSPYHNVVKDKKYPCIFFKTSTRDDRVHPAHARKMAARMESMGHDIYYYENTEGGHGAGVTNEQRAFMQSLIYSYFLKMLQ